jgi:predicted RecA/RadA family phage recombinase
MADTTFLHGATTMVNHTPGADVATGQVVVVGDMTMVAHRPISNGALGSVSAGGGVYNCIADGAIAAGKKVYWDDTNNKVTLTASGNKVFGWTITAAAANGDPIQVVHHPD